MDGCSKPLLLTQSLLVSCKIVSAVMALFQYHGFPTHYTQHFHNYISLESREHEQKFAVQYSPGSVSTAAGGK